MAKSQQIKNSFQSGVLSPRLSLRSDIDKYSSALESCVNFMVNPQGGIVMREGFEDILEIPVTDAPCRIFTFHRGGSVSDMVVMVTAGDSSIRFYIDGVVLPYVLTHNFLQSELDDLYFTNQEVTGVICHAAHPPYYIDIALDGTITGEHLASDLMPLADYKDANSPTGTTTGDVVYTINFWNETSGWNDGGSLWNLRYDGVYATGSNGKPRDYRYKDDGPTMAGKLLDAMNSIPALRGPDTDISVTPEVANADGNVQYDITIIGKGGGKTLEILVVAPQADRYAEVTSTVDVLAVLEPAWSYPTYVLHNGVYYQCILPNTPAVANEPPNATYWLDVGATKPDTFDWQYPDGNDWIATTVNAPVYYWPGGRGFPTVCVVHQQRMILMANPGFQMGVFGSRINVYKDFTRGPQDDDPFFFAIDTSDAPVIRWAEAQQQLIVGTSGGDYSFRGEVTLTPSDVQAHKQNNARSNASKAVTVNTDVFYIEQGKEKVRASSFDDNLKARTSNDISLIAENLLHVRARRIVLMQSPEVVMYIMRDDGSLVCVTYTPESGTGAWFEFESSGVIVDLCVAYSTRDGYGVTAPVDEDELWGVVTYDGGSTHRLQRMPYPKRVYKAVKKVGDPTFLQQNLVCMDGWTQGVITAGDQNVITGLDQYEGLVVTALVDDAYAGQYTVANGIIILDDGDDENVFEGGYAVGFAYLATAKTFEMAQGNPSGTAIATKRRWSMITVKTLDSALPIINGTLPPDRHPETLMDIPEIIQAGLQEREIRNLGWGDGSITIKQDRPYPTQILGFAGSFTSNAP